MGRNLQYMPREYWIDNPAWQRAYRAEWAEVVGGRIRRLRRAKGLTLGTFAMEVKRPDGSRYSPSYYSRLERGWGAAPMHMYLAIAAALGVHPGRLLGLDDAERDVNAEEMTLIRVLRREEILPDEALHILMSTPRAAREPAEPEPLDGKRRTLRDPPDLDAGLAISDMIAPIEKYKSRAERLRLDWDD